MANNIAFQASGPTYKANATTTSQTITITPDGPCNQLLVASHENSAGTGKSVYIRVSNLSNVTVTPPGNGTPQYSFVIVPGQNRVYTIPYQFNPNNPMYVAFITESATGECYLTPGEGL